MENHPMNDPKPGGDASETDEAKFLEALRGGDRSAFAELVEKYSAQVYRLALKILNDPQDAEDVLQETFIKAFHSLASFEGRSRLSTWLYRIAVNEALMLVRKRKPDVVLIDQEKEDDEGQTEPVEIVDWCCLPEADLLSSESRKFLDQAIDTLSPALRAVFLLRDVEGLSVRETAETLNISEVAVKTRLMRARLKLREALSAYYGERLVERSEK
jgi:RNA polymerase sigma-70 factor (ECF subfamily)